MHQHWKRVVMSAVIAVGVIVAGSWSNPVDARRQVELHNCELFSFVMPDGSLDLWISCDEGMYHVTSSP